MRKLSKKLALFLVFALLFSAFISCADERPDAGNGGEWEGIGEWDGTRATTPDTLPKDLNFDGATIAVLYRQHLKEYEAEGEAGSDIVYQAVYERNAKVESRLGIKFDWCPTASGDPGEVKTEIVNALSSAVDDYDYILTSSHTILPAGMNAYLWDFNNAMYIDFTQPWWWTNCMKEMAFDGKTYNYLVGEMNLLNFMTMSAFYFNSRLLETHLGLTPDDMYEKVDSGTWTLDELHRLVSKSFMERNGDNIPSEGDLFGMPIAGGETVNQLAFSTKFDVYERKPNSTVKIKLDNNRTLAVCEKLTKLMHNNTGVYIQQPKNNSSGFDSFVIDDFAEGKYVFLAQRFTAACSESLRAMEDDYGILPYPTLEEGDEYVSYIQTASSCVSVSYAIDGERFDRVCAVLEALASEAYRSVTEKFYEYALKAKYVRDDFGSPRMIDIIYNTATKYFLWEYNSSASNIMSVVSEAIIGNKSFTTLYAGRGKAAEENINRFIVECKKAYG